MRLAVPSPSYSESVTQPASTLTIAGCGCLPQSNQSYAIMRPDMIMRAHNTRASAPAILARRGGTGSQVPCGDVAAHRVVKRPRIDAGQDQHHHLGAEENVLIPWRGIGVEEKRSREHHQEKAGRRPRPEPGRDLRDRHAAASSRPAGADPASRRSRRTATGSRRGPSRPTRYT